MLINMTEVVEDPSTKKYTMREVCINPEHVTAVRSDYAANSALRENRMPDGLSSSVSFSRLYLAAGQHGINVIVVGDPTTITEKLNNSRRLLKG